MELGRLYVTIAANTKLLTAGLAKAKGEIAKTTVGMGKHFKTMGMGMMVAGAVITAAFALTVKGAIAFEAELAQVSTMLDDVTMHYMPEYKKGLQALAVEFGEATNTLSKGLYDILSASIDPAKALDVLAVSAKAAVAGITDTGVAADAITTILNSYGLRAEDAGKVSDQLFAIVKRGKTTFAELAPAIGMAAATANMAGFSFEDLGASIATVTRAGINTHQAMTSIVGILKAFLKPQEKALIAAKKFGLELNTNTLRTIGLTGVMEKLKDATSEELAAIFGSIRGLKGIAAALGDVEGYLIDYELMMNSAGLAQTAFEKQSETLKFQLGRVKQSFAMMFVEIGTKFIPILKAVSGVLVKVVGAMKKWMDAHPGITKAIVLLTSTLGLLVGAGGMVIMAILAFGKMKIALIALKGVFIAIGKIIMGFIAATGPIGWLILALGALTVAWMNNWGKIRDFTTAMIEPIKKAIGWLIDKFMWVLEKLGLYTRAIESAGGESVDVFVEGVEKVGDAATEAVEGVDELGEEVDELGDAVVETGDKLDEFGNKIESFDEWVQRLADETAKANEEMADAAEKAYEKYIDAMGPVEDRLYELTHTEEEVAAKKLQLEREKVEATILGAEMGAQAQEEAMAKVKDWYEKEIALIVGKLEEQKQALIEVANTAETTANEQIAAVRGITNEWDELIGKINAAGKAMEEAAKKVAFEKWEEKTPTLAETGYVPGYHPNPQAVVDFVEGMQKGTPFVEKTGLVKVHRGEAIFPERYNPFSKGALPSVFNNQSTSKSSTYAPNITVMVQGDGDPWAIKSAVKEGLDEGAIEYRRRGSVISPGG